jgi:lipopolysaccharide/colanic/teichoic acid biosynthesis glycosyltransferase
MKATGAAQHGSEAVAGAAGDLKLLDGGQQRLKRAFDIVTALTMGIWAVAGGLLIALAVVVDTGRPLFLSHNRGG